MGQGEVAAIGGLVFTVLTWLLGLSFAAGAGFEKLRQLRKDHDREADYIHHQVHVLRSHMQDYEVRLAKSGIERGE